MAGVEKEKLSSDFELFTVGGGLYLRCLRLPMTHAFGSDSGIFDASKLTMLRQVHGTEIYGASASDTGHVYDGCDALITADPAAVIACRTADCVPILMADAKNGVCAAVHAGWKGTKAGIAPKVFRRLLSMGCKADDVVIAIGPCARYESYEVGDDLYSAFAEALGRDIADRHIRLHPSGRLHADIAGVDKELLTLAGAKRENIFDCGLDTITDTRFRSYRREGRREPMLSAVTPGEKLPYAACG